MEFKTIATLFMIFGVGLAMNISFIPAIRRMRKTKSSNDVSASQYFLIWYGVTMWALYGAFVTHDIAIMLTNTFGSALALLVLYHIYKYKKN